MKRGSAIESMAAGPSIVFPRRCPPQDWRRMGARLAGKAWSGPGFRIRLASDEEHREAMEQQAAKISGAAKTKIKVVVPASRKPGATLRTLKELVGSIANAAVMPGSPPKPAKATGGKGLARGPTRRKPAGGKRTDLGGRLYERRSGATGVGNFEAVLNTSPDERLVDFRRRHGVGADGVINWKTFVEMKATGRAPQASIVMSNAEYERAKERAMDFILALVSGLEVGQKDEVRLIIDPANRLSFLPINGVRLGGLLEAPCIVVHFRGRRRDRARGHGRQARKPYWARPAAAGPTRSTTASGSASAGSSHPVGRPLTALCQPVADHAPNGRKCPTPAVRNTRRDRL